MKSSFDATSVKFLSHERNISLENKFLSTWIGFPALFWLLLSTLFILVESIKLHAPQAFNDYSWTNYGRIHFASRLCFWSALAQSLLWINFSQIVLNGQSFLNHKKAFFTSFLFIHISILVGIIEILSGNSHQGGIPLSSKALFFLALGLLVLTPLLWKTLFSISRLSPSLLFTSLSLWTLPFTFVTFGVLSLGNHLQGAFGAWAFSWISHHLTSLFLVPLGISALIDFTEKITERKFSNYSPLVFAFWIYTTSQLFSSSDLTGSPLTFIPAWMKSLDTVATVFSSFSILILLQTLLAHLKPQISTLKQKISFHFFGFAALSLFLLTILKLLFSFRSTEKWIQFTAFTNAFQILLFFGFLTMILFAWVYHQAPLQFNRVWSSTHLIQTHYWMTALSTGTTVLGLLCAGVIQSVRNTFPDISFLSTVILVKPFLWLQSLSLVFQFTGTLMISLLFLLLLLNWKPDPEKSLFTIPQTNPH